MVVPQYYVRKAGVNYPLVAFTFEREGTESVDQTPFTTSKGTGDIINVGDDVSIGYMNEIVFVPVFSGDVVSKAVNEVSDYVLESYGGRLNRAEHFSKIYDSKTPEFIANDIITTYVPTLTYASTAVSEITISRFVVKDETPAEAITRLVTLLRWQLRTDNSKNFYFEPQGESSASENIVVGTNSDLEDTWSYTPNSIINVLTFVGGNALFNTSESFTATAAQTDFIVVRKIAGNVRVTDNSVEKVGGVEGINDPFDYDVDRDNKTIVFKVGRTTGHTILITYSYEVPIKITAKDDVSIASNGLFSRKITEKNITTMADARKRAKEIISTYGSLTKQATINVRYDSDYLPGMSVGVVDSFNNINQTLLISKVTMDYPEGDKKVVVGTPSLDDYGWQKGIDDRLRVLEQNQDNTDKIQQYRGFKDSINIVSNVGTVIGTKDFIGHSWIVGSSTNGIVGTNTDTADGQQQVVGGAGRVVTHLFITNGNNTYRKRFVGGIVPNSFYSGSLYSSAIAHYPYSGNANEVNGTGTNGVVTGATLTSGLGGVANTAYHFDGVNDDISFDHPSVSAFTIACWVRFNNITGDFYFIDKFTGSDGYYLAWKTGMFMLAVCGYPSDFETGYTTSFTNGVWYHLAASYGGGFSKLCINGVEVLSEAHPMTYDNYDAAGYIGGRRVAFSNTYSDCDFDDLAIWNSVLSGPDVTLLGYRQYVSDSIYDCGVVTHTTITVDNDTNSSFELSADGGVHWESATNGSPHAFVVTGSDLRYRITFSGANSISFLKVVYG